ITTKSGSGNPTDFSAPMQAFWVKALANDNTVTFRQANRSHNATVKLRNAELSDVENIRIQVSNGTATDETLIGFYPNAMDAFEPHDSHKFSNDNVSMPEVFTFAGTEELAINGLAPIIDSKELTLGFRPGKAGTYTLKASELLNLTEGTKVFLKDKLLDVVQDLTQAPDYTFTSDAVTTTDRFSIVISKIATSLAVTAGKPSFTTYAEQNGQVHVQLQNLEMKGTRINVYSVSGQLLVTRPAVETNTSFNLNLPNGLYLIEVSQEGYVGRKKIVLNN
ncbi:MAG: T9SS type A sorting domain-containing protein, partial [Bacteroidia bacterium]|nr:T9SS type A sorting domain-containing protein [Bacteroidia bacterium]